MSTADSLVKSTHRHDGAPENAARDPVCGMKVDPAKARHKSEYQNQVIYFCCAGCKQAFDKAPEKYAFATL